MAPSFHIQTSPFKGGDGGVAFSDLVDPKLTTRTLRAVHVEFRDRLEFIGCEFWTGAATWLQEGGPQGGGGGQKSRFELQPGEWITYIEARHGAEIDAIKFFTNKGAKSHRYGGHGGCLSTWIAPPGYGLLAFQGRSGGKIDSLSPIWAKYQADDQIR